MGMGRQRSVVSPFYQTMLICRKSAHELLQVCVALILDLTVGIEIGDHFCDGFSFLNIDKIIVTGLTIIGIQ